MCLKCGKETEATQVFCPECLEQMSRYPVKPGTPVHLPNRPAVHERQPVRKRERTPSQTIAELQTLIRWLTVTIAVLSVLLCATAGFLIHTLDDKSDTDTIGRNYTADTSNTQP